jgi:hypothetical protein
MALVVVVVSAAVFARSVFGIAAAVSVMLVIIGHMTFDVYLGAAISASV